MLATCAALLLLSTTPAPESSTETVVETWDVISTCPPAEALQAGIARSLHGLAPALAARVRVAVRVTPDVPTGVRLRLTVDAGDGPGERELTADSCAAAIDAAAWLIAIAIDLRAADPTTMPPPPVTIPPPPEAAPARPSPTPAIVIPPPPPPTPPPPSPPFLRKLHLDARLGGGLGLGVLPGPTGVATLGLVLLGRRWQVELDGRHWFTRRASFAGPPKIGGRFTHGHAALRGCGAWERGPVRIPLCAGLALGAITGEGTGAVVPRTATSLWLGLLAGGQLWLRLHTRVRLVIAAEAVLSVRRPGFLLAPTGDVVFRPSVAGFSGLLALAVRLR